ncbi:MAG: hypothetical protein PHC51_04195 [bacterium]|nr:hypothetical protein [bacterium]
MSTEHNDELKPQIAHLPTLEYFNRTYALSLAYDDKKAIGLFRDYESSEKAKRLKAELNNVKNGLVDKQACDKLIGKKRWHRFGGTEDSYQRWAIAVLLMLSKPG